MCPATFGTVGEILNHFYEKRLYSALKEESLVADICDENPYPWQGDQIQIKVQDAFNDSGDYIPEGGVLPPAGNNHYEVMVVTTSEYAHQFQLSTRLKVAAQSKNPQVVAAALDSEMEGLKKGSRQRVDAHRIWGGRVKAVMNEHVQSGLTIGAGAGNAGVRVYQAAPDTTPYSVFNNCVQANPATWVRVEAVRQDTLALIPVTLAGGATAAGIFVSAMDRDAGTLSLSIVDDGAGGSFLDTRDATGIAIGSAWTLQLRTNPIIGGLGVLVGAAAINWALQPTGIIGNLCDPTHWTVDRTTATGGFATLLQSTVLTVANVTGAHARGALTATRLQAVIDRLLSKADEDAVFIPVMNPLMGSIYVAALTATTAWDNSRGGGQKADLNPDGKKLQMLGEKIRYSHNFPRGMIAFLNKGCWHLAEYAKPEFVKDENGNIYRLLPGTANFGGLYQMWDNLFTPEPQKHALLAGINV